MGLAASPRGKVALKITTFQPVWESKCCLKRRDASWIDYLSRPLTEILWSRQNEVAALLFPPVWQHFLRSVGRLPIWMIESALAGLRCNIQKEKQISSNSMSGFQWSSSSKLDSAVLYGPNGAPKEKTKYIYIKRKRWLQPYEKWS